MRSFKASVMIHADKEKIWSLLTTPDRFLEWFVGLDTCRATPNFPGVGESLAWSYKLLAADLKGTNTLVEVKPNEVLRYKLEGLMNGTMDYVLVDTPDGVKLEFSTNYTMSGGVLGKFAEPVAHQTNVENAKKSLMNLKRMSEAAG
jgi:carbon monoxide dehydrogenase subunit G